MSSAPARRKGSWRARPCPPSSSIIWSIPMTALKRIKRIIVAVVGGTVLALGIALMVLPGPAFLVIPAGLAILAIEFAWARRWLRSARAILPRRSKDDSAPQKKLTMKSVWRSAGFLLRRVRRTLLPKRKNT
ncbi:MAG: PGPGW domain-containing protein [Verrucomicrobia bacterium]|nr:PGPGW domain-containing protein [Verrucomicrobiota bacterium]